MSLETDTAKDIESLNKPDDSAHGFYDATTLKNPDEYDDDGHIKRKGETRRDQHLKCVYREVCIAFLRQLLVLLPLSMRPL